MNPITSHSDGDDLHSTSQAPAPAPSPAPAQVAAPIPASIQATPLQAVRTVATAPSLASVSAPRPATPSVPVSSPSTAVAKAAPTAMEPLTQHEPSALKIDVKRDEITSQLNSNATSVDGEMLLEQGIQIAGTHYGLNIISRSGIVVIPQGARILPSANRPSRIIASKVIIAGEVVIDHLQADEVFMLAPSAKAVLGQVVYGKSYVTHDGAQFRITRGVRPLTPRERRVNHWFEDAKANHLPADQSGYDAFSSRQDEEIEASLADSLADRVPGQR